MWTCLILSAISFLPQDTTVRAASVIRRNSVGPVSIGAAADDVYQQLRGKAHLVDLALEGQLSPALELTLPNTGVPGGVVAELVARDNRLIVWRIRVRDPLIRTEKGVGVGSTVQELRSAYPIATVGSGEGRVFLTVTGELSASFELDQTDPAVAALHAVHDPQAIPGSIKITSVLLVPRFR